MEKPTEQVEKLTEKENQSINTLNYVATFDGIITNEDDIRYLLQEGIEKFVARKRRHLVSVSRDSYPIKIVKKKISKNS